MMSRICTYVPLLLFMVNYFGQIRDTIKSAVAATGLEKMKTPTVKIGEQSL